MSIINAELLKCVKFKRKNPDVFVLQIKDLLLCHND